MIKKTIALLVGILMLASFALADEAQKTIQSMTELDEIQNKLEQVYKTFGRYRKENLVYFAESEKEIIDWVKA